jgi:glycosyltransferase involved in cell wall biosynthesis
MPCDPAHVELLRSKYRAARMLFYPGGSEYRKNLARLVDALERLVASGEDAVLFATGTCDARWLRALAGRDAMLKRRIVFLGRLSIGDMRAYFEAADAVVYPTLCEGFGLVCLEAMMLGAPVACSDLPVLREVAGSYACYFDPLDSAAIARGIMQAIASGRRPPRRDARFELRSITGAFNALMDRLLADAPQPT